MKAVPFSRHTVSGLLALACALVVVLATALEAEARLGPAGPVAPPLQAPSTLAPGDPSPH